MLEILKRRLPTRADTFLALSVATLLIFSWELRSLFYNAPAFFLSFTLGEFLSITAYMLAVGFLETLASTLFAVVLAVLLPGIVLRDGFADKASFLFIAAAAVSINLQFNMSNQPDVAFLVGQLVFLLLLWLGSVILVHFVAPLRKITLDIFDRLTVFTYIYLPLGALSLLVVMFRLLVTR